MTVLLYILYWELYKKFMFLLALKVSIGSPSTNVSEDILNVTVCVTNSSDLTRERGFNVHFNTEGVTARGITRMFFILEVITYCHQHSN